VGSRCSSSIVRMICSGVCRRRLELIVSWSSCPHSGIRVAQHLDHYEGLTPTSPRS
jgi:hypothetical protein